MIKFFKLKDAEVREITKNYKIYNMLTKDDSSQVSVVIGKAKDYHEITKNTVSDRIYFVLDGKILVNNKPAYKDDVIFIPRNIKYDLKGTFKVIIINSPSFDLKYDITKVIK